MEKDFIKILSDFYYISTLGLYSDKKIDFENYSLLYSNKVKDIDCNYAFNLIANTKNDFYDLFRSIKSNMESLNRTPTFAIIPIQEYLYSNKEEVLFNDFKIVSKEVWQIFDDFQNINTIKTNCNLQIELEDTTDFEKFGRELFESFKGDEKDPYNGLELGYIDAYKKCNSKLENHFYFIKYNKETVGTVATVNNDTFFDIHGLAIKKKYRKKGIGKEVIKQLLNVCMNKNKIAFIQTEEGYYPANVYRNIGFKDICIQYYFQEKNSNN